MHSYSYTALYFLLLVADSSTQDGIGPLLFSPLSEIPYIGRNPIYIITFTIFILLTVGTALCDSFSGFLVLRFLQGFFGSPCLATGAATLTDMVRCPALSTSISLFKRFSSPWSTFPTAYRHGQLQCIAGRHWGHWPPALPSL